MNAIINQFANGGAITAHALQVSDAYAGVKQWRVNSGSNPVFMTAEYYSSSLIVY